MGFNSAFKGLTYILHLTGNKVKYGRYLCKCLSQWPRCRRRKPMTTLLLRLWVRIPPAAWMFDVSVVCFKVEVYATSWSLVQSITTNCGVSLCVVQNPQVREAMAHIGPQLHTHTHTHTHIYIYIYIYYTNQSLRSVNYIQIKTTTLYNNLSLFWNQAFSSFYISHAFTPL